MDVDEVYRYLGNFGRYQILVWILLTIPGTFLPAWQMMSLVFITDEPPFHCKESPWFTLNESIPISVSDGYSEYAQCTMYDAQNGTISGNATVQCTNGWEYEPLYNETTIVMEMDLVCSRSLLAELSQSIFFIGVLCGAVFTGQISDQIGRKKVFLGALFFEAIFGTALGFIHSYPLFVIIWFCIGFFEQGVELTQFVIVMELFSTEKRLIMGAVNTVFWGVGVSSLTAIAYALPNWRYMQIAISVPCLICIPYYWLILESVRWLVSTGRQEDAKKTIRKIAAINKVTIPDNLITPEVKDQKTEKECTDIPDSSKYSILDLFRTPKIRRNSCIMFFAWVVNSMVYFGLSLYSAKLSGNKYFNFFLLGLVEIPAFIIILFFMMWWGRRPSMFVFFIGAGISCIITACLPSETASGRDLSMAIITTAAIGKFCISSSFGIAWLYATEIFPTVVRNVGFGTCSLWARVGSILAPFVIYLEDTSHYLPLNIFGVMSLIAAILGLWLPETRNRALPETIEDGENLHDAPMLTDAQKPAAENEDQLSGYKHLQTCDKEQSV